VTRIISGAAGGRRLQTPRGARTRPTSDRVREALFSRLEHLDTLAGARVLDLYAGSGALGLEAASRGAASVLLVDADRTAARVARGNAAVVALPGVVVREDTVERVLLAGPGGGGGPVDLVFLDPPYDLTEAALGDALALLVVHGWLAPDALVVVERSTRSPEPRWPARLSPAGERRYGETRMWFADAPGPDSVA
jgi:16S rRNA (guanine966-N2)-methyltransferase